MPKRDFDKVLHGCSPVNSLCIFRIPFRQNTSEGLLLNIMGLKTVG